MRPALIELARRCRDDGDVPALPKVRHQLAQARRDDLLGPLAVALSAAERTWLADARAAPIARILQRCDELGTPAAAAARDLVAAGTAASRRRRPGRKTAHVGSEILLRSNAMGDPATRRASYEDVLAAPAHLVAEIVDGVLHLSPRPGKPHAAAATALGEELGPPFKRGRGGPGGWLILFEPELHFGSEIVVPDLAGWRRERMPKVDDGAFFTLAPDWVCEVLSSRTRKLDRADKLPLYAREGVGHAWLVDPRVRTLEVLRLEGTRWTIVGTWADSARVRAEPFDAIELDLGILWEDIEPTSDQR